MCPLLFQFITWEQMWRALVDVHFFSGKQSACLSIWKGRILWQVLADNFSDLSLETQKLTLTVLHHLLEIFEYLSSTTGRTSGSGHLITETLSMFKSNLQQKPHQLTEPLKDGCHLTWFSLSHVGAAAIFCFCLPRWCLPLAGLMPGWMLNITAFFHLSQNGENVTGSIQMWVSGALPHLW